MTPEEKIVAWLTNLRDSNKWFPESVVFEYVNDVAEDGAYTTDRSSYEDGRARIFLNPKWEPVVEAFLEN